jgi:hypothetical protein
MVHFMLRAHFNSDFHIPSAQLGSGYHSGQYRYYMTIKFFKIDEYKKEGLRLGIEKIQ